MKLKNGFHKKFLNFNEEFQKAIHNNHPNIYLLYLDFTSIACNFISNCLIILCNTIEINNKSLKVKKIVLFDVVHFP